MTKTLRSRPRWDSRVVSVLAAAITLGSFGCEGSAESAKARAEVTTRNPSVVRVEVVQPERATVRRRSEQPGQIEAFEVTPLHAKLSGYVRELTADIGDRVHKGQALATLWVPEIEAETALKAALVEQAEADWKQAQAAETVARSRVTSAEAKVAEAKAGISRADAEATRWDAEYVRVSQLIRASATSASLLDETRSKQVAAQAAREEVRAQVQSADAAQAEALAGLEKAQADVIAAAARVEVAKYDLQRAEAMASYARIEAPFDGIVTRRNVDTGHLTRIYTGTEGTPLFVVARADVVSVVVGIPEPAAPWVDPGDPAQVRVQALGNRTFDGKVSRIAWALDNVNRTLMIEIDLPSQDGLLRPGLYAYATISAEEHSDAWTIPLSALIREGDRTYCVVVSQGKASRREVALGITDGPRVEVLEGLEPDDEIVKANAGALLEGQAVEALRLEPDRPPN